VGKTIAEKIFSAHAREARAGDLVVADIDLAMAHDNHTPTVIQQIEAMGREVFDPDKVIFVNDHFSPAPNEMAASAHRRIREFCRERRIRLYDVGEGICHQILPEQGHILPGSLVVGTDSHTCTYGALNCFATGIGSTEMSAALVSGQLWFKVPESVRVTLHGHLAPGVFAKDLVLHICKVIGEEGANYRSLEYHGEALKGLSIDGRITLSNMAVEMGAKAGLMEADDVAIGWLRERVSKPISPVFADADARYERSVELDVSEIEPQVAVPHEVDHVEPLSQVLGTKIDYAFLGSCTNGKYEDLEVAAHILRGRNIHHGIRLLVAPASRLVAMRAMREGIIGVLLEAGAALLTSGCGPCPGLQGGVPGNGETVISTMNRNYKGRMGNPNASIYLASPAVVAATALEGKIADPRKYL
jgi:3-isopropylmalate/(R)-2-methylmalate dehydratase large subunit